ncbi:MAG: hypothetical protein GY790_00765 [Bacteroidetes bacterium]|nr:hypothetical protein [Bacteroidota bacterium]
MLLTGACYKEIILPEETEAKPYEVISFDGVSAFVDTTDRFMLYTIGDESMSSFSPLVEFDHHESVFLGETILAAGEINPLGRIEINKPYRLVAVKGVQRDTFDLLFTTLPLIRIFSEYKIPDEPKVLSHFELHYISKVEGNQSAKLFESFAGVEIRGKSAALFDKKSFGLELWKNRYRKDRSAPLLGMRYCEDWILDAMYIDALRVRNKLSFELWNQMTQTHGGEIENGLKTGIQMEYVELFINNRYNGLYCLGEKMDERLIGFSSTQEEKGGVMYKAIGWDNGSTMFEIYNSEPPISMNWAGWEQVYPDNKYMWDPLDELRKTVVMEDDKTFKSRIGKLVDLENAAEYYLFMNLILGYDNTGKNIFYARYTEQSPLFIIPWDVEATWGKMYDMGNSLTVGILSNRLFDRLIDLNMDGFGDSIWMKWDEYRASIFSYESLMEPISQYYLQINESGAMERENARWGDLEIDYDLEYEYISSWIEGRLNYLDKNFK